MPLNFKLQSARAYLLGPKLTRLRLNKPVTFDNNPDLRRLQRVYPFAVGPVLSQQSEMICRMYCTAETPPRGHESIQPLAGHTAQTPSTTSMTHYLCWNPTSHPMPSRLQSNFFRLLDLGRRARCAVPLGNCFAVSEAGDSPLN